MQIGYVRRKLANIFNSFGNDRTLTFIVINKTL
jgi:hypothetical protein